MKASKYCADFGAFKEAAVMCGKFGCGRCPLGGMGNAALRSAETFSSIGGQVPLGPRKEEANANPVTLLCFIFPMYLTLGDFTLGEGLQQSMI